MRSEIERVIRFQEEVGLDVLVHGEPERNDMVQYFAEQMEGYVFTQNAWVQSYGSRYVRPPIIFGDVRRPAPMTVDWTTYAQSLTDRPVKGMLTGPVTMLQWSFVRDDQPRSETCEQLALAIRDEVADLEQAGIRVIQVDEPAIREGLPLRRDRWADYLDWAVYMLPRRRRGRRRRDPDPHPHVLLGVRRHHGADPAARRRRAADRGTRARAWSCSRYWQRTGYDKEIGPGVYDIHSPRVPADRGDGGAAAQAAADVLDPAADLGQPRLRPQDPRLARDRGRAAQHGRRGQAAARAAGPGRVALRAGLEVLRTLYKRSVSDC